MINEQNVITTGHLSNCLTKQSPARLLIVSRFVLAGTLLMTVLTVIPCKFLFAKPKESVSISRNRHNRIPIDHLYRKSLKNQRPKTKQSPTSRPFQRKPNLQKTLSGFHVLGAQDIAAGQVLNELNRIKDAEIWVDRRIDKSRLLTIPAKKRRIIQTLNLVSRRLDAIPLLVDQLIVLIPKEKAGQFLFQLHSNRIHARKLPIAIKTKLLGKSAVKWERGTRPNEIFEEIVREVPGLEPSSDDVLPHDIWGRESFSANGRLTYLTMIAQAFGNQLSFMETNSNWKLETTPVLRRNPNDKASIRIRSRIPKKYLLNQDKKLKEKYPLVELRKSSLFVEVNGPIKDVQSILTLAHQLQFNPPTKVPTGKSTYNLSYSGPNTLQVLQALAKQTGRKLNIQKAHSDILKNRSVKIEVKDAIFDHLLDQILKGCELKATVTKGEINIEKK